jgi:hypothetical protein
MLPMSVSGNVPLQIPDIDRTSAHCAIAIQNLALSADRHVRFTAGNL